MHNKLHAQVKHRHRANLQQQILETSVSHFQCKLMGIRQSSAYYAIPGSRSFALLMLTCDTSAVDACPCKSTGQAWAT
eukprot:620474-Pelagomonas_calceolata.AAC.1